MSRHHFICVLTACLCVFIKQASLAGEEPKSENRAEISLGVTKQTETTPGSGHFHRTTGQETWLADETAVIVCDVWDSHHSLEAVRRVNELAPRIDRFVQTLRQQGATIIHAPSDCMPRYEDHPCRKRAVNTATAKNLPADITTWCDQIPSEEASTYPVDQSDGGEDDDPQEHVQWLAQLSSQGRNPALPWLKQSPLISIDEQTDYLSDSGPEVWNVLEANDIKHVLICGVHTNMCVLGRPFGLRQLTSHGKHTLLVRDLTDTMYNPARWPFVNHFSGTDLVINHIERYVCPTTTSDHVLGGVPFRFAADRRPHLAILSAENEYNTETTLPRFAAEYLQRDFRVSTIYADNNSPSDLPGLEVIDDADALLVSVRRRPLSADDLHRIRRFVASGKPVIGLRTANHAFCLRDGKKSEGLDQWPEFDSQVFGGNYSNHYANDRFPQISVAPAAEQSPFAPWLTDLFKVSATSSDNSLFTSHGSLYQVSPLAEGTSVLLMGAIAGEEPQPVAWTYVRNDSGRSFYTSLGHESDFEQATFRMLLANAIRWACRLPAENAEQGESRRQAFQKGAGRQR